MAWDGAGSVKLETVKILAPDFGFEYDSKSRGLILEIENCYRRTQKNG